MEAEALSVDKASALHDETFTVSARVKNVGDGKFPGGQTGAALLDNGGGIVEVVGTVNSFAAVRAGESYPVSINCAATDDVAPGQYRVMIVVRQKGGGWKTAAGNAVNFAVKGAAAVTPTAAITPATVASVAAKPVPMPTPTPAPAQSSASNANIATPAATPTAAAAPASVDSSWKKYVYTPQTRIDKISEYTVEVKNYKFAVNDTTLVTVYYTLPQKITADTKVFLAIHGANMNDDFFAKALRYLSEKENIAVIAPLWAEARDKKVEVSNYKSKFLDRIFDDFVERFGLKARKYILYGFSLGGAYLQRNAQFSDSKYIDYAIVHSPGGACAYADESLPCSQTKEASAYRSVASHNLENRKIYILAGSKEFGSFLVNAINLFETGKAHSKANGLGFAWGIFVMNGVAHSVTYALPYILDIVKGIAPISNDGDFFIPDTTAPVAAKPTPAPAASTTASVPFDKASTATPLLRQTVKTDYSIRNSADYFGDLYIRYYSQHPSVSTFINDNGTVTVCVSDDSAKAANIYEFSMNLEERKRLSFPYEFDKFGAFTKDSDGNYYFFFAKDVAAVSVKDADKEPESMAMVKYDKNGKKINTYKRKPHTAGSFHGVREPFVSGTCRLEISGSMLAVHFSRRMFDGGDATHHHASYNFELNRDTFEPGLDGISYTGHSFNQFMLPIDSGFVFIHHGDASKRAFSFAKYVKGQKAAHLQSFTFAGKKESNNRTDAEMGGLAKTVGGYIFCGAYGDGEAMDKPRNLFILTFDDAMKNISGPVYLTAYTEKDGSVGHPKIVAIGSGQYLLLWEVYKFSATATNGTLSKYLSTRMQIIDEAGKPLSPVKELDGVRLSMNDVLRYNRKNGRVYWAINDLCEQSFTVYALDAQYAYAKTDINLNPPAPGAPGGGYGLALRAFSSDKNAAVQKEQISVAVGIRNVGEDTFSSFEWGVALIDNGGNIVEVIGSRKFGSAFEPGRGTSPTVTYTVPDTVPPGKYRLRIVIKPAGKEEWRVATMSLDNAPTAIDFTVR
jgi:hypothetical protein